MPASSPYAKYLPSAEMPALLTVFSDEFEVSLCSITPVGRDGTRRQAVHNRTAITTDARQKTTIRRVGSIESMIKIDEGVRRPEPIAQFVTGNHFAGMLQKQAKNAERLLLEFELDSILA